MTSPLTPYDANRTLLVGCACGGDHAPDAHGSAKLGAEQIANDFIEAVMVKALFPHEPKRRAFLKAVGASGARAAIASVVPLASLQAMAQEAGPPERRELKVGFIAITCAAPLIMAEPMGYYADQGLKVQLVKTKGWGIIRDKIVSKEHDASHFLSPMPIAMSLGLGGGDPFPTSVATIQNNNGQAITLHVKHKGHRDPKMWKGFVLAVPYLYSMHNFLLRYYLAEFGIDPDTDVKIVVVPPPDMVAKLKDGSIDGFLGPDPFNQRAVYDDIGFIHLLSKDIWDGHPCCAFGASEAFIQKNPNSFAALFRAIISASVVASVSSDRMDIAKKISGEQYLNQPLEVVAQVLTGKFPDGLGNMRSVPDRASFNPVPWQSMAVWMLTQMKRWGYIKGDVNYTQIAERVFRFADAKKQMSAAKWVPPLGNNRKFDIMGRQFDAEKAPQYAASFRISRAPTGSPAA